MSDPAMRAKGDFSPIVRNVHLENVRSSASPRVLFILGFPRAVVDAISFCACGCRYVEQAEVLSGAGRVVFDNVTIIPARKPRGLYLVVAPNP